MYVFVFFKSTACFFILFTVPFKEQMLLILIKSSLLICSFMGFVFGIIS